MSISQSQAMTGSADSPSTLDLRGQFAYLVDEWKLMFRPRTIGADALAGVAVALVALPLSLAIAIASGVPPEVGLVTAVIGGVVVAFAGGCRLQISGPAAAMTFLVAEIVAKYGISGVVVATLIAGLLQLTAGVLRLGRFMQLIPRPVIAGFLSGIGLTILCTQLPVVFGYDLSHKEEGGALALLIGTLRKLNTVEPTSLAVGATAIVIMLLLPRVARKLSAPLVAVAVASLLPALLSWNRVELLGELPSRFPIPVLPAVPWDEWNELVMAALAIFVLASLESLLSASVVDSLAKGTRTDNDQELVGQGLGNMASAFFGGLPVTGVIARSATNIQAGAKTRLAAVVHALVLLAMIFALGPVVARIPRAALAGVLIAVALRMIEVRMLRVLWRSSRTETMVFAVTAGTILLTDLLVGVPMGILAAFLYVVGEMSRLNVRTVRLAAARNAEEGDADDDCPAVRVVRVEGPLFFASGYHLRSAMIRINGQRCLVLDLERVPFLDATGSEILEEAVEFLHRRGVTVLFAQPSPSVAKRLKELDRVEYPALSACAVYDSLRDALLHAATTITADDLCANCRAEGRCAALDHALQKVEMLERTPVPRVRAVVALPPAVASPAGARPDNGLGRATPLQELSAETLRHGPHTSWNGRMRLPTLASTAFLDPRATVIGDVSVGDNVYIGPGATIRADEGTPFFIGAESNIQDGVTLHALRDKVVLVEGRPYAIYVGREVCLTHHALIHGPCYIGDRCFVGFNATVHDAVVGEGCVIGLGAVVVGVTLPPRRYVRHNIVVDRQEDANALPEVTPDWDRLRADVVDVNLELAAGHRNVPPPAAALGSDRRHAVSSGARRE